jgi:hypothetical protein
MSSQTFNITDRQSTTWHKVMEHCTARIDELRKRNDAPLSEQETASIRGEIKALKAIVSLDVEAPDVDKMPAMLKQQVRI